MLHKDLPEEVEWLRCSFAFSALGTEQEELAEFAKHETSAPGTNKVSQWVVDPSKDCVPWKHSTFLL
jgi:hypothetical protein